MNEHRHVYTKSRLIKELAFRAGIKKIASRQILEVLAEIVKRETPNGPFILPGLCKFELVPRKARRIRNPRTGELLIMPPQKALKITAARSAKLAIAPRIPAVPAALYVPPAEETPAPVVPPVSAPAPEPAPAPAPEPPPEPTPVAEPAAEGPDKRDLPAWGAASARSQAWARFSSCVPWVCLLFEISSRPIRLDHLCIILPEDGNDAEDRIVDQGQGEDPHSRGLDHIKGPEGNI